ncbi:minor tail protein [Mycobacterium phage KilKor]|uniref:Minor tail protein n=1 Tax=Mycobacterium phage KilKor TaxID=2696373 RepID=A0A6B9SYV1_9CAUD|nr:minor tail protein [Mycobacterium phage Megiddo]YP_010001322.1 minor tail protein [Mycobacterium phage KilKor]QHB41288.1 minor tail protein [Mycobacterium phage Phalm]QHB41445.1 minor tail protein [Mycobacterium phage Glaske]QHJ86279.1 minor tail protein [Mycobacterium phage CactusJack]QIG57614.1 minor tail protein [Mycobacterium phage StressBall]QHB41367.1 minor tail protein [Mycobacterium phage Megiddo]
MPDMPEIPGFNLPATSWPGSGFKGGITPGEWTQERVDAYRQQIIELILRQVVLALRNTLNPGKAFDQLRDWADTLGDEFVDQIRDNAGIDLSSWEAFVASLDDDRGIDLPFLAAFIAGAQQFFGAIDFTDPDFDPEDAAREFVRTIVQPFLNIVSRILPGLLGPLPIGLLTDEKLTLLLEGGFDDPVTIVEGSGWTHDATDGATTPLGCAVVECDGQWHIMSTEPQPVSPGWVLKAGAQVKYENVEAEPESNAVRIELVPYNGDTPGVAVWLASDESPSGSHDWDELNAWGSYTVPASGVTHVSVQTVVSDEATAGRVKVDNVYLQATQKIPQGFTKDLPEDLASLLNFVRTWVESALSALGITPSGNLLDDIFDLSDEIEWIRDRAQEGVQDAAEALSNLATLANNLLHNPGAVLGQIGQDLVENLEDDLADAGDAIADVFDDIRNTWRDIFNAITGRSQDTTTREEAAAQVAELAATTAANAALLAQLQAIADGEGNGGVTGSDDFERENTTDIGPGWDQAYSASTATGGKYVIADGHQAALVPVGSATQNGRFTRSLDQPDARTETDFQKVTIVLGTQVAQSNAVDRIYGRVSDDGTQYVFAELGQGNSFPTRIRLGYNIGAGEVITYSGESSVARSPGQIWALLCGSGANARVFGMSLGGSTIAGWSDTGNVTGLGVGFRRWGWGGASATFFGALKLPSAITRVTVADNTPVPVLGTTFRAYRASTSAVSFTLDNASARLENVFDTLDYISSDLVWNPATGTLTVTKTGTYLVSGRLAANADITTSSILSMEVFVNGARKIRTGDKLVAASGIGSGSGNDREVAGVAGVYLQAGDQVAMWLYINQRSAGNSVTFPVVGDAGGINTWFAVTKVA